MPTYPCHVNGTGNAMQCESYTQTMIDIKKDADARNIPCESDHLNCISIVCDYELKREKEKNMICRRRSVVASRLVVVF